MIRRLKNFAHLFIAAAANISYGFPSRKIKVIGITGTDGKTTTTHIIYHILKSSGKKVSMVSSVFAHVAGQTYDTGFHVTTPDSFDVQKYIRRAVDHGDEYFVLETTAHAIDQYRTWGVAYAISVITNITHEHLHSIAGYDYFATYDNYLNVKAQLLLNSEVAVLNKDDQSYEKLKRILKDHRKSYTTYSLTQQADFQWKDSFKTSLPGEYNKYNTLAAFAITSSLGIGEKSIIEAVQTVSLPQGRFEIVYDKEFKVVVDFAHTINGITQLLKTLRAEVSKNKGKLIHVFGSAGLRDKTKRPFMGEASGTYADIVIVTEEDYRTEDPEDIAAQIVTGIKKTQCKDFSVMISREKAITLALSLARKGDIVAVTGKGHEKSLARGKKEYPWSDQETIRKALSIKRKEHDYL